MPAPQLLDYLDYREYLKVLLDDARTDKPWFSLRYLGGKLDLDAGNLVKVLQKERHLPERCVSLLESEIGLTAQEGKYLALLVEFGKASRPAKAREVYERILDLKFVRPNVVGTTQYAYYRDWKPTAVLALLHLGSFRGGETEIASYLEPAVSATETLEVLQLLQSLGLARKEKGNRWFPKESLLTSGDGWKDLAIREYQRQTILLSQRALERIPPQDRDISTLTVTLGKEDLAKVQELAKEFRRAVLQIANQTPSPDQVYQLNLQLFPLSRRVTKAGGIA